MKWQLLTANVIIALTLILPMVAFSSDTEDAHTTGCLPRVTSGAASSACVSCHQDAQKRFPANPARTCTPYCMSCHKQSDMDRHHTVGTELPKLPETGLYLTAQNKVVCSTCHDLSQPRYDRVRWKASSLFYRMFHNESRYQTYFLSIRNDQGQLCLSCH